MRCDFRNETMNDWPYRLFDAKGDEITGPVVTVDTETGICGVLVEPYSVTAAGDLEATEIQYLAPLRIYGRSGLLVSD